MTIFNLRSFKCIFSIALLLASINILAQCPGSDGDPCTSIRWDTADGWDEIGGTSGTVDAGVVGCGSAASTQSNVGPNTSYCSSTFELPALGTCINPDDGMPVSLTLPNEGQDILWFNFDIRAFAGSYDFQVIGGPDDIAWALFYSNSPTASNTGTGGISGDCNDLTYDQCGSDFTGWATTSFTVPDFGSPTNYYIMVWDQDPTKDYDFSINFKGRYGCGDSANQCYLEEDEVMTSCNADGSYNISVAVTGLNGTYVATDNTGMATSGPTYSPNPLTLNNLGSGTPVTSGSVQFTYPMGINANIDISENTGATPIPGESCDITVTQTAPTCMTCSFTATCPVVTNLGTFNCSNFGSIPSHPTNESTAEAAPYNITIGDTPCATIGILSSDDVVANICNATDQTITRTITVFEDTDMDGELDGGEDSEVCQFTYTIEVDDEDPTWSATACTTIGSSTSTTINTNADDCGAVMPDLRSLALLEISDNCTTFVVGDITQSPAAGSAITAPSGICGGTDPVAYTVSVTFSVMDACGNAATDLVCSDLVKVEDNVSPEWSATACTTIGSSTSTTISTNADDCGAVMPDLRSLALLEISDNCTTFVVGDITQSPAAGSAITAPSGICEGTDPEAYTVSVTFSVMDACGNAATDLVCSDLLKVEDNVSPEWSATACTTIGSSTSTTINTNADDCGAVMPDLRSLALLEISDNCTTFVVGDITQSPAAGSAITAPSGICEGTDPEAYTVSVTFSVMDACGNAATDLVCTDLLKVEDNTDPEIHCVDNLILECDGDYMTEITTWLNMVTATDNCDSDVEVTNNFDPDDALSLSCNQTSGMDVTFTAVDNCGNTIDCIKRIILDDRIAPEITCPNTLFLECGDLDHETKIDDWLETVSAVDDCDDNLTVTNNYNGVSIPLLSCDLSSGLVVMFSVEDDCQNLATCSAMIIMDDTTPPVITNCPTSSLELEVGDSNNETLIENWLNTFTATDNCSLEPLTNSYDTDNFTDNGCGDGMQQVVTFTATDACDNEVECMAMILIGDMTIPEIVCPAMNLTLECGVSLDPALNSTIMDWLNSATAMDNSSGSITVSNNYDPDNFSDLCGSTGLQSVTFTATDACNLMNVCSASIIIQDSTDPTWDQSAGDLDESHTCASEDDGPTAPTATDNCTGNAATVSVLSDVTTPGSSSCSDHYVRVINYEATDECGNSSDPYTVTITVNDSTAPSWDQAAGALDESHTCASEDDGPTAPTATDNCTGNIATVSVLSDVTTPGSSSCGDHYVRVINYEATDECGNTSDPYTVTITVNDSTAPSWDQAAGDLDESHTCSSEDDGPTAPTATDNCTGNTATVSVLSDVTTPGTSSCSDHYVRVINYEATDECGNTSDPYTVTITVNDRTVPSWDQSSGDLDESHTCSSEDDGPTAPTATDNCTGNNATVSVLSDVTTPGSSSCGDHYVRVINYEATDECGNTSDPYTVTITVNDSTAPSWDQSSGDLDESHTCSSEDDGPTAPTATDNCTGNTATVSVTSDVTTPGSSSCSDHYERVITYLATDECGNTSAPYTLTITVNDSTVPSWDQSPGDLDESHTCASEDDGPTAPTATDNCTGNAATVSVISDVTTPGSSSCGDHYVRVINYEATDECGNTSAPYTVTITVNNSTAPSWDQSPGSLDESHTCASEDDGPTAPTATDNCTGNTSTVSVLSDVITPGSSSCGDHYVRIINYEATDECGNTSAPYTVTITVNDNTAPSWDQTAGSLDESHTCSSEDDGPMAPTATDNCTGSAATVSVLSDVTTPGTSNCGDHYVRVIIYEATDECGNTSDPYTVTITVDDSTAPSWDQAAGSLDESHTCSSDDDGPTAPTATDNCTGNTATVSVTSDVTTPGSSSCSDHYERVITYVATDECGNSSSAYTVTINVNDSTAPSWDQAAGSLDESHTCSSDDDGPTAPTATDNCTGNTATVSVTSDVTTPGSSSCSDHYERVITYVATDECGNSSSAYTVTINVNDSTSPSWDQSLGDLDESHTCASEDDGPTAPTATDNCTGNTVTVSVTSDVTTPGSSSCGDHYERVITYVATDECGNSSIPYTVTITVNDNVIPDAECQNLNLTLPSSGIITITASDINNGSSDNCTSNANLSYSIDKTSFGCNDIGLNYVTLTVVDACGNSDDCIATITVNGPSDVSAGADSSLSVCNSERNSSLDFMNATSANSGGTWTETSTTSSGVDLSDPTDVDFIFVDTGTYTFEYNIASAPPCFSDQSTVTVTVTSCFDLALRKTTALAGPFGANDVVEYIIEVFNQNSIDAYNVKVEDMVPAGMTFMSSNVPLWTATAPHTAIIAHIPPLESRTVSLFLHIPASTPANTSMSNLGIIKEAYNEVGGDDVLPNDPDNDAGTGGAGFDIDNDIDGPFDGQDFENIVTCASTSIGINVQPRDTGVCEDASASFTVITDNPFGYAYQWQIETSPGNWVDLIGENGTSLFIAEAASNMDGNRYRVVISAGLNCIRESDPATLFVNDGSGMVCNSEINISLGPDCEVFIRPDMLLENENLAFVYNMAFTTLSDEPIDQADLDEYVGQKVIYMVSDECGQLCWGYLNIEDKSSSLLDDCGDVVINCFQFQTGVSQTLYRPTLNLNCSIDAVDLTFEDDTLAVNCLNGNARTIRRLWRAFTSAGDFVASCEQNVHIKNFDVSNIEFPADTVYDYTQNDDCSVFDSLFLAPSNMGYPLGAFCANIQFYFTDVDNFEVCGASKKILRQWTVIDWCSGAIVKGDQIIKVIDDQPVIKVCPPDTLMYPTISGDCIGEINLDPFFRTHGMGGIQSVVECSSFDVFVEYLPAEPGTDQPVADAEYTSIGVTAESDGTYTLPLIQEGIVWVRYRFVDACMNTVPVDLDFGTDDAESCYFEVQVVDMTPPTAVCEGFTKTFLDADGISVVPATSIDDNSYDICGEIVNFEVKRVGSTCSGNGSDLNYGPDITFCCSDVGDSIVVMLRVTDDSGLTSECTGIVCVSEGDVNYDVVCPGDKTINCGTDFTTVSFSDPVVTSDGICSSPSYTIIETSYDDSGLDLCGVGVVTRKIVILFPNNTSRTCISDITINSNNPLDESDIVCESSITVTGCILNPSSLLPEVIGGLPTINNDSDCISPAISYKDDLLDDGDVNVSGCYTIVRTWTIIDWCVYNPDDPESDGVYTKKQFIYVNDGQDPVFTSLCEMIMVTADQNCEAYVNLIASATDNCSPNSQVGISWVIDVNNDNNSSNDVNGVGNNASGVYPVGTHKITFTAVDQCGNSTSSCMYEFTIKGNNPPTPICLAEVSWSIDTNGNAEVWASDFDLKSEGGCGDGSDLTFSFTNPEQGITSNLTFTCADIPNGIGAIIPLTLYVVASNGEYESCLVVLQLIDTNNSCPDQGSNRANVTGRVMTEDFAGIPETMVGLENMMSDEMTMSQTAYDGYYAFSDVPFGDDYSLYPTKDDAAINGVSTLDLVLIQKHILGIQDLNSPYKLIAADANASGGITAIDLLEIRKVILGVFNEYPSNEEWLFIPSQYEFTDINQPWYYESDIAIQQLYFDELNQDFYGIKVGDVNGSVALNYQDDDVENRSNAIIDLRMNETTFAKGETKHIPVVSTKDHTLEGVQFTLSYDPSKLLIKGMKSGSWQFVDQSVNVKFAKEGLVTFSYDHIGGNSVFKDDMVFSLEIESKISGNPLSNIKITSDLTKEEAFGTDLEPYNIELSTISTGNITTEFEVLGNKPNPFSNYTTVSVMNPEAQEVVFEIIDVKGSLISSQKKLLDVGLNEIKVWNDDLGSTGNIFYYRVITKDKTYTNSMVLIR